MTELAGRIGIVGRKAHSIDGNGLQLQTPARLAFRNRHQHIGAIGMRLAAGTVNMWQQQLSELVL